MPEVGASVQSGTVMMTVNDEGKAQFLSGAEAVAMGSPSDEPWSGEGDATVISLLKKIALNTTPAG